MSDTSFRVFHRGALIGIQAISLEREDEGWHLQGTGELKGIFQLALRQLDIRYDEAWRPRLMTMEIAAVDDSAVVHVAFGLADGSTRTDIVRPGNASWGANKVVPDTIPLPDFVFGAYEALAARLVSAAPGTELRVFIVPKFEVTARPSHNQTGRAVTPVQRCHERDTNAPRVARKNKLWRVSVTMHIDGVSDETVQTASGPLASKRWRMTVRRPEGPASMELWVAGGRMVRLDLPKDGLSVVRQDVTWGAAQ